jgi:hypothetical protein
MKLIASRNHGSFLHGTSQGVCCCPEQLACDGGPWGRTNMTTEKHSQTVKTSMEMRRSEPELPALLLSTISTGLVALILCVTWLVFVHQ